MKYLITVFVFLGFLLSPHYSFSQEKELYDTAWIPITKQALEQEIRNNMNSSTMLYQLWRRARYQKLSQEAFDFIKVLKETHSQNANLWAIYCMMIEQYMPDDNNPRIKLSKEELAPERRRYVIDKTKQLNPKNWLIYAAEARFEENTSVVDINSQILLYQKALECEPNLSFTNNDYASALSNQATINKTSYDLAISFKSKAQKLNPINCESSLGLIMMYRWRVPNAAKEKEAAESFLKMIPPNIDFSPERREWLAQWGIHVSK